MEQVLLEWEGGNSAVLARIKDVAGYWLCSREVNIKVAGNIPRTSFDSFTRGSRHTSDGVVHLLLMR